jgi:tight adherence protein B
MSITIVFCFLLILAMLLFSISFGLRFHEGRRQKKLVSMLRTVTQNGHDDHVNLLVDRHAEKDDLQALVGSFNITEKIARLLSESGLDWSITRLAITTGVVFLIAAVAGTRIPLDYPVALRALGAGLCAAGLPLLLVSKKRTARLGALETQLPDALDFLARSMRAGHAFSISLEMVGEELADPLGQEFRALFNEQNLGASLERSFAGFAKRVPIPDVRFFSSAVLLQRQTGGNLSEILNRLSHIIRERFRLKGQVKAASAHGKMTATILTLLPVATLVAFLITSPGYLDSMFTNPLGRKVIALGIVAQVIGNFFIRRIIKIKV